MKTLDIVIGAVLVAAGLSWGMMGLFDFNIVATLFGETTPLTRFIYILVGIAAIYDIVTLKAIWKRWNIHFQKPAHA